jgi:hypothetical protein
MQFPEFPDRLSRARSHCSDFTAEAPSSSQPSSSVHRRGRDRRAGDGGAAEDGANRAGWFRPVGAGRGFRRASRQHPFPRWVERRGVPGLEVLCGADSLSSPRGRPPGTSARGGEARPAGAAPASSSSRETGGRTTPLRRPLPPHLIPGAQPLGRFRLRPLPAAVVLLPSAPETEDAGVLVEVSVLARLRR